MRFRRLTGVFLALGCALPGVVLAGMQANQAKVTFSCSGPGGLRIEGTGSELQAVDKGDALAITVPVAKITTGIGIRDTHMHGKYLESQKYPTAELVVPRSGLTFPADGKSVDASAPGTLTIHGKSKPVTFHYKATRKGKAYEVQGDVKVDMRDYGIETPTYLGITVKPPVDIAVSFQLVET
jgi:polyisoprenoid-binding protein YceI